MSTDATTATITAATTSATTKTSEILCPTGEKHSKSEILDRISPEEFPLRTVIDFEFGEINSFLISVQVWHELGLLLRRNDLEEHFI